MKHWHSEEASVEEQFYYFSWGDARVPLAIAHISLRGIESLINDKENKHCDKYQR